MLHQVTRAIMPDFSLRDTLRNWDEISCELAESPRKRMRQSEKWAETS
jgi:hypothetical protein